MTGGIRIGSARGGGAMHSARRTLAIDSSSRCAAAACLRAWASVCCGLFPPSQHDWKRSVRRWRDVSQTVAHLAASCAHELPAITPNFRTCAS